MVNCCVTTCNSRSDKGNDSKTVSFHEFPLTDEMRKTWLFNINRPDWIPSDRSVVCSLHFPADAFSISEKRKRLKPGAIPTKMMPCSEVIEQVDTESKMQLSVEIIGGDSTPKVQTVPNSDMKPHLVKSDSVENSQTNQDVRPEVAKTKKRKCPDAKTPTIADLNDYQDRVQLLSEALQEVRNKLQESRRRCKVVQVQKLRLQRKMDRMKESLDSSSRGNPNDDAKLKKYKLCLEHVLASAENHEIGAIFLLHQLESFGKKRLRWSEQVFKYCVNWRARSAVGYNYPKQIGLLRLPGRTTLGRFVIGNQNVTTFHAAEAKDCIFEVKGDEKDDDDDDDDDDDNVENDDDNMENDNQKVIIV